MIAQYALYDPGRFDGRLKLEGARCSADELSRHIVADLTQVDHLGLLTRPNEHFHLKIHVNKISSSSFFTVKLCPRAVNSSDYDQVNHFTNGSHDYELKSSSLPRQILYD